MVKITSDTKKKKANKKYVKIKITRTIEIPLDTFEGCEDENYCNKDTECINHMPQNSNEIVKLIEHRTATGNYRDAESYLQDYELFYGDKYDWEIEITDVRETKEASTT